MSTALADVLRALRLGKGPPTTSAEDSARTTRIVRLSDVDYENESIDWTGISDVSGYDSNPQHLLQTGDILVVSRGAHRTALLVEEPPARAVADRTFYVARPDSSRVEPAYLVWYLNEQRAQAYLKAHSRGTNMQTITKKALQRLPVKLPDLDTQREIADINRLARREADLLQRLAEQRTKLASEIARRKLL